jgi:alcohol dehydrogenase class IV
MEQQIKELFSNVSHIGHLFKERNIKSLFLIRGNLSFENCGAKELFIPLLKKLQIETTEFYDFATNPHKEDVERGSAVFQSSKYDIILAIGGGSVLDMAKLIRDTSFKQQGFRTTLAAVPTTAGTGAESTNFAVCYEKGIKRSIEAPNMMPDYVILYPPFTYNNDLYLTACTGFDALAQSIESLWNIYANKKSEELSLKAIGLLFNPLLKICSETSRSIVEREHLIIGANLSGQAINITHTTAPHAFSYSLTSRYHYPHGHAVALTFPYFFEKNLNCRVEEYAGKDFNQYRERIMKLKRVLKIDESTNLFEFMKSYINKIGLGYDANKSIDSSILVKSINIERAKNNPLLLSPAIINQAIQSIYLI